MYPKTLQNPPQEPPKIHPKTDPEGDWAHLGHFSATDSEFYRIFIQAPGMLLKVAKIEQQGLHDPSFGLGGMRPTIPAIATPSTQPLRCVSPHLIH